MVFDAFAGICGQAREEGQKAVEFEFVFVFFEIKNSYFA